MFAKFKALFITLLVIILIVVILGVFLLVWFFADSYKDFKENFTEEFYIPGLEDGVVPQGLGSYTTGGKTYFLMCCYMKDGSASRIYFIDPMADDEDPETGRYVTLKHSNGQDFTGHCGGIATDGKKVWLSSETYIYTFSYNTIESNASSEGYELTIEDDTYFKVDYAQEDDAVFNIAYLFYDSTNKYLYAGEFYREKGYPTISSHQITTPAGDENTGIVYKLERDTSYDNYINPVPVAAYSTPSQIQGLAIASGKIALSESYGLANSHIYVYDEETITSAEPDSLDVLVKVVNEDGTAKLEEAEVPLYYMDSDSLIQTYEIPCMSEGMAISGDDVYVLFESAGKKYRLYVRERLYNVYSFSLSDVEEPEDEDIEEPAE